MHEKRSDSGCPDGGLKRQKVLLVCCRTTQVAFADQRFEVESDNEHIRVAQGAENFVLIRQKNQQVPYKATILGGVVLSEEHHGDIDYKRFFTVDWPDEFSLPELHFRQAPCKVTRHYEKGERIELGLEDIAGYHVTYRDGVEAHFDRRDDTGFDFSFSTGFYGFFEEKNDGSYVLTFKGDRLKPEEDDLHSQSKFIVSRSKYTGKMLLILQDDATVSLK